MIFYTKQTIALNAIARIRNGSILHKDKAKKSKEAIVFLPSYAFVSFFSCDTDILYK